MKTISVIIIGVIFILIGCRRSGNRIETPDSLPLDSVDTIAVSATSTTDAEDNNNWTTDYFVDDFGEDTNERFILNTCYGEFSNSATTDSPLRVGIIVTSDEVRFDMFEYGSIYMKGEETLQFRAKLPDNSEVNFKTYNYENGPNVVVKSDYKKVIELFKKYPKLRFAAKTTSNYSLSTYRFTYECNPDQFNSEYLKFEK